MARLTSCVCAKLWTYRQNFAMAHRPSAREILTSDSCRSVVDSTCDDGERGTGSIYSRRSSIVDHAWRPVLDTA